ncbi:predicted protein [Botrytis cinerea T4]|uniref:Uncharacterized protein n=1 Tax=Botryotinia fuckeliana (strain T4) TaxID=999810 RepID=G2XZ87_BOTF4|nr:predicted protein [Botrytis cinerea T4]
MYSASKPVAAYSMRIINCLDKMSYVADRDEKQKMLQMRVSRTVEVWWSPEHTCVFGNERARCFSYLCKKGDGHRWHHGLQTRGKVYRFTRAHSQKHPQKIRTWKLSRTSPPSRLWITEHTPRDVYDAGLLLQNTHFSTLKEKSLRDALRAFEISRIQSTVEQAAGCYERTISTSHE